jgi:anti-anti-sigma factor
MTATNSTHRTLAAPASLGLESRKAFREQAVACLQDLPEGLGRLVIDLSETRRVDSAGLGVLMLVQRAASERRQSVVLRGAGEEIRYLLALTRLADLFEFE